MWCAVVLSVCVELFSCVVRCSSECVCGVVFLCGVL